MYRVSFVERWRQWMDDEDASLDKLFDNTESNAMRVGTAFHKALEQAPPGEYSTLEANGCTFEIPEDCEIDAGKFLELRACKTYMVDGKPITITGQVDSIDGLVVVDHKTTARFDPDRYLTGYQWRLYLDIFEADIFHWNVFELDAIDEATFRVRATHRLEQYRYPGLGNDCQRLVADFARSMRAITKEAA